MNPIKYYLQKEMTESLIKTSDCATTDLFFVVVLRYGNSILVILWMMYGGENQSIHFKFYQLKGSLTLHTI